MKLRLVRPSIARLLCSIIAAAILTCLITGIALTIAFSLGYNGSEPAPTGEYVRLAVTSVVLWGPIFLLTAWWISVPVVILLGGLAARIRREPRAHPPRK
jgi:hypothetical protein